MGFTPGLGMAFERFWASVSPRALTADGSADGYFTVADISGFYVKQRVFLQSSSQPATQFQIKRIDVDNNRIWLGPGNQGEAMTVFSPLSGFLVADGAFAYAEHQGKSTVPIIDQEQATYETEPIVAKRVILVDEEGKKYNENNPLPVNATVSVVVPPVTVDLDALTPPTQANPDNALMAGSEDGTKSGLKHAVRVDADLDLRVGISDGSNKAVVDASGDLHVADEIAHTWLQDISQKLESPIQVDGTINADMDAFNATPDNVMTVGSVDGTKTGTKYGWVNNVKQQIMAAHDRKRDAFYLDISSKKDRRLDKFEYTSPTFPGVTLVRQFSWTLVGTEYVYENDEWSVI